jgi:hypothetical protein
VSRDPEKARERNRRYRERNRETILARQRQRAQDPAYAERRREYARNRYRDNPEVRERQRQQRQARRAQNRAYQRTWREANRPKLRAQNRARRAAVPLGERWAAWLWKNHGLRPDGWHELWLAGCWICGEQLPDVSTAAWHAIHIDHDHRCCPVGRSCLWCRRGLAHSGCNTALGLLGENPARLRRIAANLAKAQRRTGRLPKPLTLFDLEEQ